MTHRSMIPEDKHNEGYKKREKEEEDHRVLEKEKILVSKIKKSCSISISCIFFLSLVKTMMK
jgi:hypothetical protein